MAREGLLRFGRPASVTAREAAAWLDQLSALLRHLEAADAWREADLAASNEQRRRERDEASQPDGRLKGMNTIGDVATFARVSTRTVERAVHNGDLTVYRIGGNIVRIPDDAVFNWLAGRQTTARQTGASDPASDASKAPKRR